MNTTLKHVVMMVCRSSAAAVSSIRAASARGVHAKKYPSVVSLNCLTTHRLLIPLASSALHTFFPCGLGTTCPTSRISMNFNSLKIPSVSVQLIDVTVGEAIVRNSDVFRPVAVGSPTDSAGFSPLATNTVRFFACVSSLLWSKLSKSLVFCVELGLSI